MNAKKTGLLYLIAGVMFIISALIRIIKGHFGGYTIAIMIVAGLDFIQAYKCFKSI